MFSLIYNYISSFYYDLFTINKLVELNEDMWIKNQVILWQNNMYMENPHLQNIPQNMIEMKKEYFRNEYKNLFK